MIGMIAMSLTWAVLSHQAPSSLADPPDSYAAIIDKTAGEPSETRLAQKYLGYRCVSETSCPANVVLVDHDGNVEGCSNASLSCSGNCYTCSGNSGSVYVCRSKTGSTCVIPPVYRIINCGLVQKRTNACTGHQPAGVPGTPNGCYCNLQIGAVNMISPCSIAECQ